MQTTLPEVESTEPPRRKYYIRQPDTLRVEPFGYPGSREDLGEDPIPCVKVRGMWLSAAGLDIGARLKVHVKRGCVMLTLLEPPKPDVPKVRKMGRLQLARLERERLQAS
ncbi:SymE family type I addiction module toxin [Stenotrophomonas sp. VV52]|uniref:SymE family type I addiction module toxin n=1 Tax=Stenotrophomonas sp. VV52 TaxID=2066958 RepID=UPI001559B232|nr:SymE family type I addiction module toxin [Stenotrophomonas sp. VV52]